MPLQVYLVVHMEKGSEAWQYSSFLFERDNGIAHQFASEQVNFEMEKKRAEGFTFVSREMKSIWHS